VRSDEVLAVRFNFFATCFKNTLAEKKSMSTKSNTNATLHGRGANVAIGFCLGIALLFTGGCEKVEQPKPAQQNTVHTLNAQEQLLVGRWDLKRTETYEMAGTDSSGNCICNFLNATACDSTCGINFFNTSMAAGTIGGCDPQAPFSWSIPQSATLQTNNGPYHIEFINHDSMAVSDTHVKDILQIKDVFYYRKSK
jgi:hypothetical protein